MHRSPGVFFDHDKGKTHSSGKYLFAARVIPYRGSWLDFEFDAKDLVYVRIDRRRKLPATTLLLALVEQGGRATSVAEGRTPSEQERRSGGMSTEEILNCLLRAGRLQPRPRRAGRPPFDPERTARREAGRATWSMRKTGKVVAEAGTKMTPRAGAQLQEQGLKEVLVGREELVGRYVADDLVNEKTGEIYVEAGDELTEPKLDAARSGRHQASCRRWRSTTSMSAPTSATRWRSTRTPRREEALIDIYRVMRPGEPPTLETAEALFQRPVLRSRALRPVGRSAASR